MGKLKNSKWLNLGLTTSIVAFVLLAGAAGVEINKVSKAAERMEETTDLLEIAGNWLGDVRQHSAGWTAQTDNAFSEQWLQAAMDSMRPNMEAQKLFFARVRDEETRQRASELLEISQAWLTTREQIKRLKTDGEADASRRKLASLTHEYIKGAQALTGGLLDDMHAAGKEIKGRFITLYVEGAGMMLTVIAFAALLGWKVLRNNSSHAQAQHDSDFLLTTQRGHLTSQEEIGQLLKGLSTIRD